MSYPDAYDIAKAARTAFEESQFIPAFERIKALEEIRNALVTSKVEILDANRQDLEVWLALPFVFSTPGS
jgi:glutamate-5-semialdehyde dehydrogenase